MHNVNNNKKKNIKITTYRKAFFSPIQSTTVISKDESGGVWSQEHFRFNTQQLVSSEWVVSEVDCRTASLTFKAIISDWRFGRRGCGPSDGCDWQMG